MTKRTGRILIVDDDKDVLQAARLFLKQHVAVIQTETDPEALPSLVRKGDFDIILLDMNFTKDVTSGAEGIAWLDRTLKINPSAIVVMITAYADVDMAVRAIKRGATDFIGKPWQNEKLLATVLSALALSRSQREVVSLRTRQQQLNQALVQPTDDFIGVCDAMQRVFQTIRKVATTDANVLILGGNGTGKELAARALHQQSARSDQVFIKVDMGAISETLFESELFGHKKGAFTDARQDRAGRFEIASGGTLFLDEIGNLPLPLQVKLLTALQSHEVTRVGSNTSCPVDIRLICASNVPLAEMVASGTFREDLLYRINTVELQMPSLRERVDDIKPLAEHFLEKYCRKYRRSPKKIAAPALAKLQRHHWPGNVRELQHALERAVIMNDSLLLGPEDFILSTADSMPQTELGSYNLEEVEKTVIRLVLAKNGGNISRAAEELGLTRASLYRRLERYGL
ncbi:MAG: sigma-54-dependent Fis family transcriptional regulator [Candidatus Zixiibacteriota bacterium]|nr:MAG: sigma-54-dependent Fis family transcriptional regulator [candidate division Zixibacteria bacterium]